MTGELTLSERLKRANWTLLALAVGFTGMGVLLLGVASEEGGIDRGAAQLRWAVIGIAACLLTLAVPYRRIVQMRYLLYGVCLVLLVAVLVAGRGKSAGRWIGFGSLRLQPSELMKVVLIVTLAGHIRYQTRYRSFRGLAIPFALTLVPLVLIMRQPDLGTALLLVPILFVLLYVAGARARHLGIVALAGVVAGGALFFVDGLMSPYQKNRVHVFLHQGSRDPFLLQSLGHQLHRSKVVVGTASAWGSGIGEETRDAAKILPERHSDFVFPVLVTAFGSVGTAVFLVLFLLFVALLLRTAIRVREPSGRLLAVGAATLFLSQGLINMAMTVGLLPIVGLTLPFVSYGGSSLVTSFVALGLALNAGADPPVEFGRGDFE